MMTTILGYSRCNMACGRHADVPAIHIARSAADNGNDSSTLDTNTWLGHQRTKRLQRFLLHHHLDHRVPLNKSHRAEVQAWIIWITRVLAFRLYSVYNALRTISFREDETRECWIGEKVFPEVERIEMAKQTNVWMTDVAKNWSRLSIEKFVFSPGTEAILKTQTSSRVYPYYN